MSSTSDATPVTFDPCGVPGSEGGCSTCPMAAQCAPRTADEDDYFVDPAEPQPDHPLEPAITVVTRPQDWTERARAFLFPGTIMEDQTL